MQNRIDRSKFIKREPSVIKNSPDTANSTAECRETWGKDPAHYRYINVKDTKGNKIPLMADGKQLTRQDGAPRFQKKLVLIGESRIKWEGHAVLIRLNENEASWYKHWPVAAKLLLEDKLPQSEMEWFVNEGSYRFLNNMVVERTADGKHFTPSVQALIKAKVLAEVHGRISLIEANDEIEANQAAHDATSVEKTAEVSV